jgi:tetratricopeptide (TPR) repeat protein
MPLGKATAPAIPCCTRKKRSNDRLGATYQIGNAKLDTRDSEAAEGYIREALAIQRRKLSAQDPQIAITLQGLGLLMGFKGDRETAQRLFLEALDITRQVYEDEHPAIATLLERIGLGYQYLGNLDQSEATLREAVAMCTHLYGEADFRTVNASSILARTLHRQGKLDEALSITRRVMHEGIKQLGARHPLYIDFREDYATLLRDTGDFAAAEPILLDVLAFRQSRRGETDPELQERYERRVGRTRANLAALYKAWGRPQQAERFNGQ